MSSRDGDGGTDGGGRTELLSSHRYGVRDVGRNIADDADMFALNTRAFVPVYASRSTNDWFSPVACSAAHAPVPECPLLTVRSLSMRRHSASIGDRRTSTVVRSTTFLARVPGTVRHSCRPVRGN